MPERLVYKYTIFDSSKQVAIWEREPSRELKIQPPEAYRSYKEDMNLTLGPSAQSSLSEAAVLEWKNTNDVFLVNGHIEKSDANFVGDLSFQSIGEENIFIGPYPMTEDDIEAMASRGVTGVFNV